MPYATIADISAAIGADRLLELADLDADGQLDTDTIQRALDEAAGKARSYLDDETVPEPTPPELRRAVVDIAVHNLREPRGRSTEYSLRAHNAAIDWLERIAEGKATLTPTPATGTGAPSGDIMVEASERQWPRDVARRLL